MALGLTAAAGIDSQADRATPVKRDRPTEVRCLPQATADRYKLNNGVDKGDHMDNGVDKGDRPRWTRVTD